jgi:hypothetical protein
VSGLWPTGYIFFIAVFYCFHLHALKVPFIFSPIMIKVFPPQRFLLLKISQALGNYQALEFFPGLNLFCVNFNISMQLKIDNGR